MTSRGASNQCTGTVTVVNNPPTANAGLDQTVDEGTAVRLSGSSSDPDTGQTVTFQWTQTGGPAVMLSGADTAMPTFYLDPEVYQCGDTFTFQLTVTDSCGATSTDTVVITIGGPCCA